MIWYKNKTVCGAKKKNQKHGEKKKWLIVVFFVFVGEESRFKKIQAIWAHFYTTTIRRRKKKSRTQKS